MGGEALRELFARITIRDAEPGLDDLVVIQCATRLGEKPFGDAAFGHGDDGLQMVCDLAEAPLFFGRQHPRSILTGLMGKRSKSSQLWIERQKRDPYVKKAAAAGLGSRAHFKLAQLDARFALLRGRTAVLELGAAPGGWTRYLAGKLPGGRVIAVDYRPMQAPPGVTFLCLDIQSDDFDATLAQLLGERKVGLVLSDMSPNISGVKAADQAATMELAELATTTAIRWLEPGGGLVVKMFQGSGVDVWIKDLRRVFSKTTLAKPAASRSESREIFAIATGFTGAPSTEDGLGSWPP